jgi:hypothetical protein
MSTAISNCLVRALVAQLEQRQTEPHLTGEPEATR